MKSIAIKIAFALCIAWWAWVGWHYIWPVFSFLFGLFEQRQGPIGAWVSMSFTLVMLTWIYYGMAMNLKRAIDEGRAPIPMLVLGYTMVLPPGLFLDWLVNMGPMTVISGDLPESAGELVTGRLDRWWWELMPWRQRFADALARDKLDPYDIPSHIRR